MTGSPADLLAIALDRARRFAERRPDDARAQRELLEAEVAFLRAEIGRRDRRIVSLQRRLLEIARRLKRANALLASARRPGKRAGKRGGRRAEAGPGQEEFWRKDLPPFELLEPGGGARP